MDSAPKDREIYVYAEEVGNIPLDKKLPPIEVKTIYHEDAGFEVDEIRTPTKWRPLDEDLEEAMLEIFLRSSRR